MSVGQIRQGAYNVYESASVKVTEAANRIRQEVAHLIPVNERVEDFVKRNAGVLFASGMLISAAICCPVLHALYFTAGVYIGNNLSSDATEAATKLSLWISERDPFLKVIAYTALFVTLQSNPLIFGLGLTAEGAVLGMAVNRFFTPPENRGAVAFE